MSHFKQIKIRYILIAFLIAVFVGGTSLSAQTWEEGFPVEVSFQELEGADSDLASVTLSMLITSGTPLIARDAAMDSALSALHDLWNVESIHEDIRGFLDPAVPVDVQAAVSRVNGSDFVTAIVDAFSTIENDGFSRFQADTSVRATERIEVEGRSVPLNEEYPDPPRFYAWVVGGENPSGDMAHDRWVIASLVNYSASILSFRSETGRFPSSFAELRETNHLLIEPLNPYNGQPVEEVMDPSPGDITYQVSGGNTVLLLAYIEISGQINVIRREISVPSGASYDLLYRHTAGMSESDKKVARYVFQIAQILNEYYYENQDLPYNIPQCEAEGFGYVSFPNPYTYGDAQQADSLADIQPGDYTYHRISESAYFLVGYGGASQAILSISKDFAPARMETGIIRTQ
jgi:hypothetical protein